MTKSNLKYLYRAVYNDGTVYDQNIEDKSITDPTKSCYSDVNIDQVRYFTLSDGIHSYILDLSDGGFSAGSSDKFYLTTEQLMDFKLVHYRRVTLQFTPEARIAIINFVLGYEAKTSEGQSVTKYIIIK